MQSSPLSLASTWELVADDYAVDVAPTFEYYAREALRLARLAPGMRVIDVAAGPGTLSLLAAEQGATVEAVDFAPRMVALLRAKAAQRELTKLSARVGDGMALPYPDRHFSAGFSMFGLMFFPDRAAGFQELARVLEPGGRAVVSSWVPLQENALLAATYSMLAELTMTGQPAPSAPALPLASVESCREEMTNAGFREVVVHRVATDFAYPSTRAMVASFARSSAPVALTRERLGAGWLEVEMELTRRLCERFGSGPQCASMPAHVTVGLRTDM